MSTKPMNSDALPRAKSLSQMDFLKVNQELEDGLFPNHEGIHHASDQSAPTPGSSLSVRTQGPTSPLQPTLAPTLPSTQFQSHSWFSNTGISRKKEKIALAESFPIDYPGGMKPVAPQFGVLHGTAITGDKSRLQKLILGDFCDIDQRDKFDRTPLMFAVLGDYPECVDVLLKHGADPHLQDRSGRTALHWAVHHGHFGCVKSILSKTTVGWSEVDQGGVTILHLATRHPLKKGLQTVFKHFTIGPGEIDVQDKNKRTPLHWACSLGHYECVRLLLKAGAQQTLIDVEGKTPFHWAASSGGLALLPKNLANKEFDPEKCIQLLLESSTQVLNWQDYEGRMALHLAIADSGEEVVQALLENDRTQINALDNNCRSPLHWAAILGKHHVITALLDQQALFRSQDAHGATPLHYAVSAGHINAVETLMRRPEVLDNPDFSGRTALMWAAGLGSDLAILQALSRHGSDLKHTDNLGLSALHIAVTENRPETVKHLLKLGADANETTYLGQSSIHIAAQFGHCRVAQTLMEHGGCSFDQTDVHGWHALHWAGHAGQASIIEALFDFKSDLVPNLRDEFGRSPLILAAFGGYIESMQALLKRGADVNLRDNEGMCALHWATRRGHLDAVRLLLASGAFPNHIAAHRDEVENGNAIPRNEHAIQEQRPTLVARRSSCSSCGSKSSKHSHDEVLTISRNKDNVSCLLPGRQWDQFTPLDSAIMGEFKEIIACLLANKGLTLIRIQNIAATRLQAFFRGARIRKCFNSHKSLLLKHEQLRAQKRGGRGGPRRAHISTSRPKGDNDPSGTSCTLPSSSMGVLSRGQANQNQNLVEKLGDHDNHEMSEQDSKLLDIGGTFLSHVVEVTGKSAYVRRVPQGQDLPLMPTTVPTTACSEDDTKKARSKSNSGSNSSGSPRAGGAVTRTGTHVEHHLRGLSLSAVTGKKIDLQTTRSHSMDAMSVPKKDQKYSYNMP
ncbi:inversin-like [Tigriopus californicus]|uniref:inversin-like n=1 Tax=Tigriopus californicus TaxID=6832 RepID=UPI0027D9DA13|nr:inversin-like [Tigriopus californicus]